LNPLRVEIIRAQPAFEIALARRPLAIEHGKPDVIAIAALGNHVLAESALVDKSIAQRGPPRGGVERIALPFVAAIAEHVEDVTRQEILGFGAERGALQGRRIEDMPHFDHTMRRNDPQQREVADGAILRIDYRIGAGIVCGRAFGDEGSKISRIGERTIGRDVGPDMIVAREYRP
jgi:hypothetical protein